MTPDQARQAACLGAPFHLFFPHTGAGKWDEKKWRAEAAAALAVCATCPVLEPCRDDTLTDPHSDNGAVRGGLTPPEIRERTGRVRAPRRRACDSRHNSGTMTT